MGEATAGSRAEVRSSLERHQPTDPDAVAARRRTLDWLASSVDPFDPARSSTHITASALVVRPTGLLLHRHKRLGIWLQPGGHVDLGESPWAAAARETLEETGLAVKIIDPAEAGGENPIPAVFDVDVHHSAGGHIHLDLCYLAAPLDDAAPAPPPGESQEVRWFSFAEAIEVGDRRIVALAQRARALAIGQAGG